MASEGLLISNLVSVRLIEAKNLDWHLFWISDQRLIKWICKSCHVFKLGLHLNWAMPTSLPTLVVYIQHRVNSPLSRKLHFLPFQYYKPNKYAMSGGHFQCKPSSNLRKNFPNHLMTLWSETWKRHQSKFSASMSLIETISNPVRCIRMVFW